MQANHAGVPFIGPPKSYRTSQYPKRYIIIHNTANDATARGEADYAKRRTDGVSSHYYGDSVELIQSLNTSYGANHVGSSTGNNYGISYEFTGTNGKSYPWWSSNLAWDKVVTNMALDCQDWGIPARLLTIDQMRDGKSKGFATHDMARQAWGGTTHTDPGPNFPLDFLIANVGAAMAGITPEQMLEMYQKVNSLYSFIFFGGDFSSGDDVPEEYALTEPIGNPPRVRSGNSLVEQLNYLRGMDEELLERPGGGGAGLTYDDAVKAVKQALKEGTDA